MRTQVLSKALIPLVGIVILSVLVALWSKQQHDINSLEQQIKAFQQQIDTLPVTVTPKDKLVLKKDRLSLEKDRVNAQNATYSTLLQAFGSAFFVVTAYFTYRNLRAAEASVKAAEEKQVTERFSKAIELLGSEKLEVRLGGIYALERIAKDSETDHWSIMEVLTAYVREKSLLQKDQLQPKPATDIQAIMTILGRRTHTHEKNREKYIDEGGQHLDLTNTSLRAMALGHAHLEGAILSGADLQGSYLSGANLEKASLVDANLQNTQMSDTILKGAFLNKANLEGANFSGADLEGANLSNAILKRAYLRGAKNLTTEQIKTARDWQQATYDKPLSTQLGLK